MRSSPMNNDLTLPILGKPGPTWNAAAFGELKCIFLLCVQEEGFHCNTPHFSHFYSFQHSASANAQLCEYNKKEGKCPLPNLVSPHIMAYKIP